MLRVTDLAAASDIAHEHNVRVIVDNTFASPYIQQPLALGCDIVTHSTTKFLNGHSDSVGGVVVLKHQDDIEWMKFVQNAAGAILGPMDSWLVLRGTKTLPIRMERTNSQRAGAGRAPRRAIRSVQSVIYPGLPDHPHHALATRQMRGFGGLISFDVGSIEAAQADPAALPADVAGRKPGRRRDADLASGGDDPRLGARRIAARRSGSPTA